MAVAPCAILENPSLKTKVPADYLYLAFDFVTYLSGVESVNTPEYYMDKLKFEICELASWWSWLCDE